jgi:acetoin utilization protein AcuB
MLVRNSMSKKVIKVEPQEAVAAARALMDRHRIRQLPVMQKHRLVGIVTDRDLRSAPAQAKTVAQLMTRKLITIAPNASVDEAARLLRAHKIGALPVVERNKVIGILSASDVMDAFVDLSGVREPTYRLELSGARGKQAAQEVRQAVHNGRGELKWLHPDSRDPNRLHLRLKARRIDDIVTALEAAGLDVTAVVASASKQQAE